MAAQRPARPGRSTARPARAEGVRGRRYLRADTTPEDEIPEDDAGDDEVIDDEVIDDEVIDDEVIDDEVIDDEAVHASQRGMTAAAAARAALSQFAELIGKPLEGATAVQRTDDGWWIEIEVIEDHRIPSSADILALYEVETGPDGELTSYRRTGRYPRGRNVS